GLSAGGALVHLGVDEEMKQGGVQLALLRLVPENVEGLRGLDGFFVRTVGGSQRVVDVADGHDPGLNRDLRRYDLPRMAFPVPLLVVAVGDLRSAPQLAGPRDGREEAVGMLVV